MEELSRQQLRMKDQFLSHVSHELRTPIAAVYQFATILSDGIAGDLNEEKSTVIAPKLDFLSEISREVRTPATIVAGYAGMLRDKLLGELTPEQENVVEKVLAEINDLMLTVTNIFEAARIDSTTRALASGEVDTGALLEELRSLYDFSRNGNVPMTWDCPADLPVIVSDGSKLRLILQNLIHSSRKLSTRGQVTITARHSRPAQVLEFSVATRGMAFPKELFEHSAASYSAGDSLGNKNWGIYLVDTCAQLLGGTIAVESDGEKTSTVTLRLPVKETAVRPGTVRSKAIDETASMTTVRGG